MFLLADILIFAHPWLLAGLVAVCGPILLSAAAARRGRRIAPVSVLLRCVALAALVFALSGPSVRIPQSAARKWLILNDVSASTRTQQTVGGFPAEIAPRLDYAFADGVGPVGQQLGSDQTNLAGALRLAAARADELAGVVVRTDGGFTDEHWPAAARSLGRAGVTVAVVALDRPPRDIRISEFTAARIADRKVALRVTVIANSITESVIEIPGVFKREIKLLPGEPASISVDTEVPSDRGAAFTAILAEDDAFVENNRASASVGPIVRRAAVVGQYDPANLASDLSMPTDVLTPRRLAESLDHYAALLLADDSGQLLEPELRRTVAAYVRNGGGLVLLGAGPYASAADRTDPLNQAAALVPNPYDRKPIALTVALDASGSMGQNVETAAGRLMKFDQAAEAVLSLKRHLTDCDTLRVVAFADRARELYSSGSARPDFARLAASLRGVRPTGATKVFPAMELAAESTPDADRQGLLIIVSDLQTEKFDPAKAAEMLKKAQLDLAIVAIASPDATPSTEPLEGLVKLLDASLAKRDHLVGLARIFVGFLRATRGGAVRKGRFKLTATVDSPLAGKEAAAYIASTPHADSDVLLHAGADEIIARRTVGLGRSVTIALAASDSDNSVLLGGREFTKVLASSIEWAARPEPDSRFSGRVVRSGRNAVVSLRAEDSGGKPINLLDLSIRTLADPNSGPDTTAMRQVAPGRYVAEAPLERLALGCDVTGAGGGILWRGGLRKTYRREFDAVGPNYENLRRLAALTGGRVVQADELGQLAAAGRHGGRWSIWPWLAGLALLGMLADWLWSGAVFLKS